MDLLFYEIRRFVSGFVSRDVAGATGTLALRAAIVCTVLHQIRPWLLGRADKVVPHLVGGSLLSFSYPRANLIVAFGFGNRLLHRLLGLLRGSCRVLLPVVSALSS